MSKKKLTKTARKKILIGLVPVKTEDDIVAHHERGLSQGEISRRSLGKYSVYKVGIILKSNGIVPKRGRPRKEHNHPAARKQRALAVIGTLIYEYLKIDDVCPWRAELLVHLEKGRAHFTPEERESMRDSESWAPY